MGSAEGSDQQDALLLTAGQVAVAALGKLRDAELCEKLFGVLLLRLAVKWTQTVCGEEAAADDFLTGRRKILLEGSLLRQIADLPRGESIAGMSPSRVLISVDLPEPFSPTMHR